MKRDCPHHKDGKGGIGRRGFGAPELQPVDKKASPGTGWQRAQEQAAEPRPAAMVFSDNIIISYYIAPGLTTLKWTAA